jgi:ribosomal-protein-alanine N-acetyltransferase
VTTTVPPEGGEHVRQAVRADLLAVYRIERSSFPQPWPFETFERYLDSRGFLVAETTDGEIAGYVVADTVPNHGRPLGHVKDIAVHPERRGEGLGGTLLERALGVLRARDASRVKLEVREDNDPAIGLYRDYGFDHHHTVPRYYEDGTDAHVMTRRLD